MIYSVLDTNEALDSSVSIKIVDPARQPSITWATRKALNEFMNLYARHRNASLEVEADGEELGYIRSVFTGIPMHNGERVLWTGESALFILNSIPILLPAKN